MLRYNIIGMVVKIVFSKKLVELRKKVGLSQEELAKKLQMTRGQLSMYEIGKRKPDMDTVQHIADFFGVSLDELLGRSTRNITNQDQQEDLTETPLTSEELAAIERIKNDPEAQIAFKDFLSAPIKKQRSMLKAWEAFKNMDDN